MQKFVPRSRVRIFRNKRNRSTPLDPKLMFWSVFYYLGAFGTVWLARKNLVQNGPTGAKVRVTKSRWNYTQRTHPILLIGLQTLVFSRVLVYLVAFGTVWLPYSV